ncbi:MAG: ATP-grasp domain-containing protein [archaeon]
MNLTEKQGKELFSKYGIETPKQFTVDNTENEVVVKAQILTGKRGKGGGIKFATLETVKDVVNEILGKEINGHKVNEVLIEEKLNIEKELYCAITLDRENKGLVLVLSLSGGMDIEEVADKFPERIIKIPLNDIENLKINFEYDVSEVVKKMFTLTKEYDATLVEINPLVVTSGKLVAADSKVVLDDNALFRHPEFKKEEELTEIENKASQLGLQYVELEGDIAVIGNGAGLVMATLDVLNHYGGKAANFLDIGGGASVEKMEQALEIVLMKKPKGILINIFGGITKCDDIATGLLEYKKQKQLNIPFVVRLIGTNEAEGKQILTQNGIDSLDSMEDSAKKIVEMTK